MQIQQNRRHFLTSLTAAGAAGLLSHRPALAAEAPPETTTIRLASTTGICFAPLDVAEELLRAEGFTDVQYVKAARRLQHAADDGEGRGRLRLELRRGRRLHRGCRPADRGGQRPARRLLRVVRARADPEHRRSQGAAGRHPDVRLERVFLPFDHGQARRPRPQAGHRVGRAAAKATPRSCSPPARPTPFSAFPRSRRSCARARSGA